MQYGICPLSIVSLRLDPSHKSELISQVLYGDFFKIIEERKKWSKIRVAFDKCEGWIANNQITKISKEDYQSLNSKDQVSSADLVEYIQDAGKNLYAIPLGASLNGLSLLEHAFDGSIIEGINHKEDLIKTSFLYLNSPYMLGGKTPFGIDSSGFAQMVYKINGYKLPRHAADQAGQGEVLSFIEESEPGDLAFFDDSEGNIIHVGIILKDHHIIHSFGKVRIDRLDQSGIYNEDLRTHTHRLRVIKKII